jgi:phosphoheptose isomerase
MQDLLPNKNAPRKSVRKKIRTKKKMHGRNCRSVSARAIERHSLSVYSGTIWLGSIEQVDEKFTAQTTKGKKIAVFGNLKAAADAVSAAAEAA